jgi:hypothetical protein
MIRGSFGAAKFLTCAQIFMKSLRKGDFGVKIKKLFIPYLCLTVWFQPEEGANLEVPGVDDAGAHVVLRVRVNVLKQLHERKGFFSY